MPACDHLKDPLRGKVGPVARTFPGDDALVEVGMMCGDCGKHLTLREHRIVLKGRRSTLSPEEKAAQPQNALPNAPIDSALQLGE